MVAHLGKLSRSLLLGRCTPVRDEAISFSYDTSGCKKRGKNIPSFSYYMIICLFFKLVLSLTKFIKKILQHYKLKTNILLNIKC